MHLISVRCQHCGAPLSIDGTTRFVTCKFCGTQLTVQHTDSSVFTRAVQELTDATASLARDVRVMQVDKEIEELDRSWAKHRATFVVREASGNEVEPTRETGITIILLGVMAAIAVAVIGWVLNENAVAALFILPLGAGIFIGRKHLGVARLFEEMTSTYRDKRRELQEKRLRLRR
jgi:uncharacterized Zn finger protein (UPF0148 family)